MATHLYGNMYRKKQGWESVSLGLSKFYSDSVQWTLSIHPSIHSPQKKIYLLSRTFFWPTESFHLSASLSFFPSGNATTFFPPLWMWKSFHHSTQAVECKWEKAETCETPETHSHSIAPPGFWNLLNFWQIFFCLFCVLCCQTLYNQHHGWVCWALDARDKVAALNIALNFSQTFPEGFLANGSFPEKIG